MIYRKNIFVTGEDDRNPQGAGSRRLNPQHACYMENLSLEGFCISRAVLRTIAARQYSGRLGVKQTRQTHRSAQPDFRRYRHERGKWETASSQRIGPRKRKSSTKCSTRNL